MTVLPMDSARWEREVLGSKGPVLVQFWRRTCPICPTIEGDVQALSTELEGRVPLYRVDCDAEEDIVWAYEVQSTPTFIVFCGGEPVSRLSGRVDVADVRAMALDALEVRAPCGAGK